MPPKTVERLMEMFEEGVQTREGGGNWGKHKHGEQVNTDGRRGTYVTARHVPGNLTRVLGSDPKDYFEDEDY